jgi:hypothetical protein
MKGTAHRSATLPGATAGQGARAYATPGDFCAIFSADMDSLYSLALVLTRNHDSAQQCFVAALNDCRFGSAVFPEWARSWSRRMVIKNAIRLLDPLLKDVDGEAEPGSEAIAGRMDPSTRPYLQARPFDRFVFVISVLEGFTVRECAALLGSSPREVEQARLRVLQQIAGDRLNLPPASYGAGSQAEQNSVFTLH